MIQFVLFWGVTTSNGKKVHALSLRQECLYYGPLTPLQLDISQEALAKVIREEKEIKVSGFGY